MWKKDDWVSVWIGFLILILFMAGVRFALPKWAWMTDGAFHSKLAGWSSKVEALGEDAEQMGAPALATEAESLEAALGAGKRVAVAEAAGKLEKIASDVEDADLKSRAEKLSKEIKDAGGRTFGRMFAGGNLVTALYALLGFGILAALGIAIMGLPVGRFLIGFPIVFLLALLAGIIGGNTTISDYGLETVFWALLLGLLVSNTVGLPGWLKEAVKTEYFIKIGLVLLGAEILFTTMVKVGAYGMVQSIIVIAVVFCFCFWLARKLGLDDEFASILASAVSICGVSAAISAGGAVRGDPRKVSHTISLVLLCAIPMLIFEPVIAKAMGWLPAMTGAWLGGTIDTTGAVVAAGAIAGPEAMSVAVVVKMAQNVLIGVAAFLLAVCFVFRGREGGETPGAAEIWFRFPKFVLGFIVASLVFSFFMTEATAKGITSGTAPLRGWWFTLAFVCIGLDTRFKELVSMGGGRPAAAFLIAQVFNILWTLLLAWLIFGGVLFPIPKF
jgi:uncharacterized integral membrane protein (TIGR00698 family)